jgi:hypothetical protein
MFKDTIKELYESFELIPEFFRIRSRIFLTNDAKVAMTKDGNMICSNNVLYGHNLNEKRYRVYTLKTFFIGRPKLMPCIEKDVMDTALEFLLFKRLSEKKLTAQDIIHCKNQEIRRELLDRYGYDKFLINMRGIVVHTDGEYQLIKLNWHDREEPIKLVRVKDSTTSRWYVLRVPPTMKTVRQAIAWTFDLAEPEYHPLKET